MKKVKQDGVDLARAMSSTLSVVGTKTQNDLHVHGDFISYINIGSNPEIPMPPLPNSAVKTGMDLNGNQQKKPVVSQPSKKKSAATPTPTDTTKMSKAALDNRSNQLNSNHKPTGPVKEAVPSIQKGVANGQKNDTKNVQKKTNTPGNKQVPPVVTTKETQAALNKRSCQHNPNHPSYQGPVRKKD